MTLLTDDSINRAEHDGHDDEPRVPVVMVVHRGDPEEHKYDGLRAARQHFHRVLDGGVRLVRYIRLDVILHGDAAEGDPTDIQRKSEVTVKSTSMSGRRHNKRGWLPVSNRGGSGHTLVYRSQLGQFPKLVVEINSGGGLRNRRPRANDGSIRFTTGTKPALRNPCKFVCPRLSASRS